MARRNKFKSKRSSSINRVPKNLEDRSSKREPLVVFSFKDFDRNQGQSFKEWEMEELLALACEKLSGLSSLTIGQALQQRIIKVYTKTDFPPESGFEHPKHVPDGVKWASMHIQGKECIIGHLEENIFHIVFLDKDHEFWKTKKKNT
ncbi:MAG: hypothetical protein J5I94_02360 [Phaeodactylibacter sp.]|nr:hypothetical protein [Phaeodactylibacter sp.]